MAEFTLKQYEVERLLGVGGMARVYQSRDTVSGRAVALKVSRKSASFARETLANEYECYKKLDHPCFPKVYDLIEDDDRLVMVMELLEGDTLEGVMEGLPEDPPRALELMIKVMEAMSHVGERGLVHSDLKPANVILQADQIKIIDFGVAAGATSLTAEDIKEIKGTLSYLSPEQADGQPLDIRSDIFSAGVLLYESLTGRRPFDSGYDMATLYSIMYEEPTPPSRINSKLGAIVDRVVMGALAKDPAERFPDFAAFRQALEALRGNLDADDKGDRLRVTVAPALTRGGSEDDALFAEGLTEELVLGLSQLKDADVTPLAQVKKYIDEELTPEKAREEFGADILVASTIRRAGDKIRITVTLTRTKDAELLWNEKYDSTVDDLFELQDTVTAEIVGALRERVSPDEAAPKVSRGTENVEAFKFYLKGRNYLTRNTQADMEYARKMLERAIEIDPNYPLAYAGMADLHGSLFMNFIDRSQQNWDKGLEMAKKAIELDPAMPYGYRAQGRLLHLKQRYDEAIELLKRAAMIDATYGETYRTLAWACEGKGALSESLAWTRKALSINPHDEETILLQGILNYDLNNMAQAVNAFQRCLELKPDYGRAHYFLAKSHQKMGQFDQALRKYVLAVHHGGQPEITWDYGWLQLCLGNVDEAIRLLEQASAGQELEFAVRYYLGIAQRIKGENDKAQENFGRARLINQKLIDEGDTTFYPHLIIALVDAATGQGDSGEKKFLESSAKIESNGELAVMCAHYCAERGWRDETAGWLQKALNWRLGFAEPEALIDPFFIDYQDVIKELGSSEQAA